MKPIQLERTAKTPAINFDPRSGKLSIMGNSIPENSLELYQPLIKWVQEYVRQSASKTEITVALDYFNTSSSKLLYELLKPFELIGQRAKINWYYHSDDEEIQQAGQQYQAMLEIPFELIEKAPPV